MSKSYVTLEQRVCVVCGRTYDSGGLLLDTRLRERFEHHTVTGWGMCPEDEAKRAEYVALVEVKNTRVAGDNLKPQDADRTGVIAHVRRSAWTRIFDVPAPAESEAVAFVEVGVIDQLKALIPPEAQP
jgi:hypothetical protein